MLHLVVNDTVHSIDAERVARARSRRSSTVVLLGAVEARVEVELVALETEHGLVGGEQVVRHRAVRLMAEVTVLLHGLVLEDERALPCDWWQV